MRLFSLMDHCAEFGYGPVFYAPTRRHERNELERVVSAYRYEKFLWDWMNAEIEEIVGLDEIKQQLQEISHRIKEAQMYQFLGKRVVPPRPIHMAFIGPTGTGKSKVAEVFAKAFFLGGFVYSPDCVETNMYGGTTEKIFLGRSGVLFINVHTKFIFDRDVLNTLIYVINEGQTSIIFSGMQDDVNCMINSIDPLLHEKLSATLRFNCPTYKDMARILWSKLNGESTSLDNIMRGLKWDTERCTIEDVEVMLERVMSKEMMETRNWHMVKIILDGTKYYFRIRTEGVDVESDAKTTIILQDLEAAVQFIQSHLENILLY